MNQENVLNALTVFLQTSKKHSDIASTIASIYYLKWIVLLFFHVKGLKSYCHDILILCTGCFIIMMLLIMNAEEKKED